MPDPVQSFTLVDVPGGVPLLGHLGAFKVRPLETMSAWWRRHGDALRFRLGPKTLHRLLPFLHSGAADSASLFAN